MKEILNFLIEASKLKEIPRTGWVLMKVKNPETIAEHTFRLTMAGWLLAEKKYLNIKKAIKLAFFHDFCEVYAGDVTPFFYYTKLTGNQKEKQEGFRKWVRLSQKEKEKRGRMKFNREKRALLRLIKNLEPRLKNEIFSSWLDYEKKITKEGNFIRQIDRIETLIQSIEYFGIKERVSGSGWWEGTEEIIEDPLLLEFLKVIQKKFYGKAPKYKKNKELENILDCILKSGKLKKMPRLYWISQGIKTPETVAGHIFTTTLLAWLLGKEKRQLNMEKLLKMALCHEISAVYTEDTIPYVRNLPRNLKERREILKRWPRLPKEEKEKRFLKDYKEEKETLEKLTVNLNKKVRKEIIQLWDEYRRASSPEARFLTQVNTLAVLFQGLQYQKKYKGYFTDPLWEWAFEKCEDPICFNFMEEMKRKFY